MPQIMQMSTAEQIASWHLFILLRLDHQKCNFTKHQLVICEPISGLSRFAEIAAHL